MKSVFSSSVSRRAFSLAIPAVGIGSLVRISEVAAHDDHDVTVPHPAHIHNGTCAELGEIVAPLGNVSTGYTVEGTDAAGADSVGSASSIPVALSVTTVSLALADILAGDHAIMVHESEENMGNYIACGNIGGSMLNETDLPIGLASVNDSDYAGVATLHDNGDGTTTVTVTLVDADADVDDDVEEDDDHAGHDDANQAAATPDDAGAATGLSVTIKNFAFDPTELNINMGDTVTWTNDDSVPHTATQKPSGSGFQSGTLSPGDSFSFAFEEAGEFDYFCEFHGNMAGKIIVS
jgi:plastocyanin